MPLEQPGAVAELVGGFCDLSALTAHASARPIARSAATTSSSRDVATSALISAGGLLAARLRTIRTGASASANANRPISAGGCRTPITSVATNAPAMQPV